jgi:hypothetical protein
MTPPLPDHWRCEQCGRRFLLDFQPAVMCTAHSEGAHCHTGHQELMADGSTLFVPASPSCLPFATTEWVE